MEFDTKHEFCSIVRAYNVGELFMRCLIKVTIESLSRNQFFFLLLFRRMTSDELLPVIESTKYSDVEFDDCFGDFDLLAKYRFSVSS